MTKQNNFPQYLSRFQQYFFKYRTIPTMEKSREILGFGSLSSVHNFYSNMIEYGFLKIEGSDYTATSLLGSIPFYEFIQAGFPSPATDELKQDMRLEEYLIEKPIVTIFVKVKGMSMRDAGILDGDAVIVEKGRTVHEGDIVVAIVDNEYTLKYYHKENGKAYLAPANDEFENIYPTESLEIFGVVVGSFRKYL